MGLGVKRLRCFLHNCMQVAARLAIHKSLPKSQASFDLLRLFSNLSICLEQMLEPFSEECRTVAYLSVFDVYNASNDIIFMI